MQWKTWSGGLVLLVMLGACGAEPGGEAEGEVTAEEGSEYPELPVSDEAMAEEKIFAEGVGDDKCALLTMEDVVAATGRSAEEIEQRQVGSACLYQWDDGSIYFGSARVNDSLKRAKATFERETRDVTAEETAAAKEKAKGALSDRADEGELTEEEAEVGSALMDLMPEEAITHRPLEGVGNEASLHSRGSVIIRYGNVIIRFSGKTDDEDRLDPELAREIGKRIVANLDAGGS